jgi:parallel beta-helix repeat protein
LVCPEREWDKSFELIGDVLKTLNAGSCQVREKMVLRTVYLLIVLMVIPSTAFAPDDLQLQPHAPIRITGDSGFTRVNGVVSGLGTVSDPYVIEGWEIGNNNGHGIIISGTSAYFVIQEVYVHYIGDVPLGPLERVLFLSNYAKDGIVLQGARNGKVHDSKLSFSHYGIRTESSSNIVMERNRLENVYGGILVINGSNNLVEYNSATQYLVGGIDLASSGNIIRNNQFTHGGFCFEPPGSGCFLGKGIVVGDGSDNVVTGNLISDQNTRGMEVIGADRTLVSNNVIMRTSSHGIDVEDSENVTITSNQISESGSGISVTFGSGHVVTDNAIFANRQYGIGLFATSGHTVAGNLVDSNPIGVWLQDAVHSRITGNDITNNAVGIFLCRVTFGDRFAPPPNDFSGTRQPFRHCRFGPYSHSGSSSSRAF